MGPFEDVIESMGVECSLYVHLLLKAPWGIAFETGPHARLLMIARGSCWLAAPGIDPLALAAGDCVILKAGVAFSLQDEMGRDLVTCPSLATRLEGRTVRYGGDGRLLEMMSAALTFDSAASEPLMALLPKIMHVGLGSDHAHRLLATLQMIGMETVEDRLGAGLVIARLMDVLFLQTIRAWLEKDAARTTGWLAGLQSHRIGRTIRAMHRDLAHAWTVDELADLAGLSRSRFAAEFKDVVGEAPLGYLTKWRIYRAKAMLRDGSAIAQAAECVGYESDSALSRAFKRAEGMSPKAWRTLAMGDMQPTVRVDQMMLT